jgi:hypothetical protein
VRALTATGLCGLTPLRAGAGGAATTTTADTQFANYAFASELGSGIYELSGRAITVYQLQPGDLVHLDWAYRSHEVQLAPYVIIDLCVEAPEGPTTGISARTVQFEAGLMLDDPRST